MNKALLIGCGNIGAGCDLHDESRVWTHAKAYSRFPEISLTIFDTDAAKAAQVAGRYSAEVSADISDASMADFDLVSITTPTPTHFSYLQKALKANTPVIICEKPIVASFEEALRLNDLYESSSSKVLVNYMRRFQPAFIEAREKLTLLRQEQGLRAVVVKYKRGFLNNAGHAIDLLEFLFQESFRAAGFQCSRADFDAFEYDPTLTGCCLYAGAAVSIIGVPDASYGIFEMELFFGASKVVICHSGDEIRYYHDKGGRLQETLSARVTDILGTYMMPVMQAALHLLQDASAPDNFKSSLRLNMELLKVLSTIKTENYASIGH